MVSLQEDGISRVDVAVVGAGPGGLATAAVCAHYGLDVTVVDEQPTPGGQIYRGLTRASEALQNVLGEDYRAGSPLVSGLNDGRIDYRPGTSVWEVTPEKILHLSSDDRSSYLAASQVVLATGAMERPFPIPGWTLPGVMTAGAAQILLKTAAAVAAGPVVLAGCGPLLYLVANQYLAAGGQVMALVDTTDSDDYRRAARHAVSAALNLPAIVKGLKMISALKRAGIPMYTGASDFKAIGEERVRAFEFRAKGRVHRLETNVLLLHQGVVPNTQATWSLRVPHTWSDQQLCWLAESSPVGELSGTDGIFAVGDNAMILGAEAAAVQGRMVGFEIACRLGRLSRAECDRQTAGLARQLTRARGLRRFLDALYRPKLEHRVPADAVPVCRCEEVTAGELRAQVALGCLGPNQLKSFSRCGMGPCQGRQCGLVVTEIIAAERGVEPEAVGYFRVRSPIKRVTLGQLTQD